MALRVLFVAILALPIALFLAGCHGSSGTAYPECLDLILSGPTQSGTPSIPLAQAIERKSRGFTQGLLFHDGRLFESTGLVGSSELRELNTETGEIERSVKMPSDVFGEGAVVIDRFIIVGTWKSNRVFFYDIDTFELIKEMHYPDDIWGLTSDGEVLIVSNGTQTLTALDPRSLEIQMKFDAKMSDSPLVGINELEWVEGKILANVWPTNDVYAIDYASGSSVKIFNVQRYLTEVQHSGDRDNVLNGIAYDKENRRLLFTGKNWDRFFYFSLCDKAKR